MIDFKIPGFLNFGKKHGLLIADDEVSLVSWKGGDLELLGVFKNDEAGSIQFADFLAANKATFEKATFSVLINVIGEDYRFEKAPHLFGKFKYDFHNRRMGQLFRGSKLSISEVQGREERGRREDWVLFHGILSEAKVTPWLNAIVRGGKRSLAGVFSTSYSCMPLFKMTKPSKGGNNALLMTVHEKGLLRQTYYSEDKLRFGRVSKIQDQDADAMGVSIRRELERTIQYLNSLKLSVAGGLDVQFICPSAVVGQLREKLGGGDKVRFVFHDVATVAQRFGVTTPLSQLGKDSSLALHSMFSRFRFRQLAPFERVRYYNMNVVAKLAMLFFVVYGGYNAANAALVFKEAYLEVAQGNTKLQRDKQKLQQDFDSQTVSAEERPSSPENMRAVSTLFNSLTKLQISPTQLIYFFSQALEKNSLVSISEIKWFLSNSADGSTDPSVAVFNGEEIYQVLEVTGVFLPKPGENYLDVANRAEQLVASIRESERSDIGVVGLKLPTKELASERLSGVLEEGYAVDSAKSRDFIIRITWKEYDENVIKQLSSDL